MLDLWFEKKIKPRLQGQGYLIRYADDYVCLIQKQEDARWVMAAMRERFAKFGLELNAEKTRVTSFGRYESPNAERQGRKANTFDFLGFTHYCGKNRNGKFLVGRRTCAKKFRAKCRQMNQWFKSVRNLVETKDWWAILRSKLTGHYRYYGVSGNSYGIGRFHRRMLYLVRKWLNRRSQRRTFSWANYWRYLEKYPLPSPRIFQNFYPLNSMPQV